MTEENYTPFQKKQLISSGVCPEKHETEAKVCMMCYEELLKKYNALLGINSGKAKKSQWQTW